MYTNTREEERSKTEASAEKIEVWRQLMIAELKRIVPKTVDFRLAELLVLNILRHDGLDAVWIAGPMERGADIIATLYRGYGIETKMAVQVKFYQGEMSDAGALDQLERAFQEHRASALLLVTFADSIGESLKSRIEEMRRKYIFDVLSGDDLYSALLELIADRNVKLSN